MTDQARSRTNAKSAIKHWMITINHPTEEDKLLLDALKSEANYWVIGSEVGDQGTPHLQCFFSLKKGVRMSALKAKIPRAHLDRCNGTTLQCSDYCKKGNDFTEGGDMTLCLQRGQAATAANRERYAEVVALAKKRRFDEIEPGLLLRHYSAIKRIAQDHPANPPDAPDVTGFWYHGTPRSGKSATARYENPGFYDKPCNKWWDGYAGQDVVIIDDFDLNHKVLGHHVKRWLDRYSFPAEVKGTTIQIRPLKVIITSNYTPEEIWVEDPTTAEAIRARCQFKRFDKHSFNPSLWNKTVLPPDAQEIPPLTQLYCDEMETIIIEDDDDGYIIETQVL